MSKWIVDIHGDIEGDYEIIKKYEEQQPCDDAVSRQDVLDLVKKGVLISNKNYNSVCEAINKLPSAQPEQRWIPCSERLPEDDDDVIITTGFEIYIGWFDADDHTWRLRNDYITSIVAWMPLPEPYKAESEDKE